MDKTLQVFSTFLSFSLIVWLPCWGYQLAEQDLPRQSLDNRGSPGQHQAGESGGAGVCHSDHLQEGVDLLEDLGRSWKILTTHRHSMTFSIPNETSSDSLFGGITFLALKACPFQILPDARHWQSPTTATGRKTKPADLARTWPQRTCVDRVTTAETRPVSRPPRRDLRRHGLCTQGPSRWNVRNMLWWWCAEMCMMIYDDVMQSACICNRSYGIP